MQDILNSLSTYGYIALFFYSLGGGFFGIVAAAALSFMGKMDFSISIVVVFFSNYIGDMIIFYLSRYNKEFINPMIENHKRKLALSNLFIRRYGDWVVFIQKYIYGVKTLVPIAMGYSKYSFVKFGLLNIPATALFVLVFGSISYKSSEAIITLFNKLSNYPWLYPLIILSLLGGIYFYFQKATAKK